MLRFSAMQCLQKFAAVHSSARDRFNQERYLCSRDNLELNCDVAFAEWRNLGAAQEVGSPPLRKLVGIRLMAPEGLDRCVKQRQHAGVDVLLGERRLQRVTATPRDRKQSTDHACEIKGITRLSP